MARSSLNKTTNLVALLSGEAGAFGEFVRRESPRLCMILQIVRDEVEAHSVLQETFFHAYTGLGSFRREARLSTWLYSIGRNQAYQWLRIKRRCITMEGKEVDRIRSSSPSNCHARRQNEWNPYTQLERAERSRLICAAINNLSPTYRQVVVLHDLHELSTVETARVLNISEDAVRVRLCRARGALRALLREVFFAGEKSLPHH